MNLPAESQDYDYVRIHYPAHLNYQCPVCESPVEHLYSNAGKLVHCLERDILQVVELYKCTDKDCPCSKTIFNPAPRFDYGGRHYGADVFRFVADEFLPPLKQKPNQILTRLHKDYPQLEISEATIARMCDDILKIKAFSIDQKTLEIIKAQGFILLGMDGQDPGKNADALWCFMDLVSNRILGTRKFESLDYQRLHEYLQSLASFFDVPIIGWVTDKQNLIVKCHDTYYKDIPHQYCQYHFQTHLWDHIEALDSRIFMPLKKTISKLYIHTASPSKMVEFENIGPASVRTVFKSMDKDLQSMSKVRNKTFKQLRGLSLYSEVEKYVKGGRENMQDMDSSLRVSKILKRTYNALEEQLGLLKNFFIEVIRFEGWFQKIRAIFNDECTVWQERQRLLDLIFKEVYDTLLNHQPSFDLEKCRSFLPGKKKDPLAIMGEWCRLWNSYLPGLFQYSQFPGRYRTNGGNERAFSKEKQMLIARVGKGVVGHMIATRGEDYLRLTHCSQAELDADIIGACSDAIVKELRQELRDTISNQTSRWRTRDREYLGYEGVKKAALTGVLEVLP